MKLRAVRAIVNTRLNKPDITHPEKHCTREHRSSAMEMLRHCANILRVPYNADYFDEDECTNILIDWAANENLPDLKSIINSHFLKKSRRIDSIKVDLGGNKNVIYIENASVIGNLPARLFYNSREWKQVRYFALEKYGNSCQCCGATPRKGIQIHVDHIKPRSLFPDLSLDVNNLQILCEPCNIGKSNVYQKDWRITQ